MLSKSQISLVKSLHQKKFRKENNLFFVEGIKAVTEFLNSSFVLYSIYIVPEFVPKLPKLSHKQKVFEVSINELQKISVLQNPQGVLAVFEIPKSIDFDVEKVNDLVIVLDGIQDPGNMGTIIRTADWFGFKNIICSIDTVDVYNPKVVQASMGSLARIRVVYNDLGILLSKNTLPVYGALLDGANIFKTNFLQKGYLIFGNEGNGISEELKPFISKAITIPGGEATESLNVSISAAICCAEIRRNMFK
ncbi:RNA methyltransferase [Pedobacter psychrophilus]|uniref:RNA methyltransferase n=1 Tax=Pedobacter psychrophilus TaxID=1826909 RepID=A0A179DFG2_9SPHI|nr:RNA methyltransferase [Pedobacter psychrophilus]OAQ39644.1 RNA methyltransferase [Pedobacter psychrophilus]